jgi:hypothetical protein
MWRAVLHHTERKAAIGEEGRVEPAHYGSSATGEKACLGRFLRYRPLSLGRFFTVVVLKVPMAGAKVWRLPERRRGVTRAHASSNAWTERLPDFGHFLREDGGELVMLDAFGPGCVFRMFFPVVAGPEGSGPAWRLRVRIDGKLAVDLSVEELSELATPPFIHPLAGHTPTTRRSEYQPPLHQQLGLSLRRRGSTL